MSQPQTATKYNDANEESRKAILRSAKIEEGRVATLAKSQFDALPKDVQDKLNVPATAA